MIEYLREQKKCWWDVVANMLKLAHIRNYELLLNRSYYYYYYFINLIIYGCLWFVLTAWLRPQHWLRMTGLKRTVDEEFNVLFCQLCVSDNYIIYLILGARLLRGLEINQALLQSELPWVQIHSQMHCFTWLWTWTL